MLHVSHVYNMLPVFEIHINMYIKGTYTYVRPCRHVALLNPLTRPANRKLAAKMVLCHQNGEAQNPKAEGSFLRGKPTIKRPSETKSDTNAHIGSRKNMNKSFEKGSFLFNLVPNREATECHAWKRTRQNSCLVVQVGKGYWHVIHRASYSVYMVVLYNKYKCRRHKLTMDKSWASPL